MLLIILCVLGFALFGSAALANDNQTSPPQQTNLDEGGYFALDLVRVPTRADRQELESYGIKLVQFLRKTNDKITYWCYVPAGAMEKMRRGKDAGGALLFSTPRTRNSEPVSFAPTAMVWQDKLSAEVQRGEIPEHAQDGAGRAIFYVITMPGIGRDVINQDLSELGVSGFNYVEKINLVYFALPMDRLEQLATLDWVRSVSFRPAPEQLENAEGAEMLRATVLNSNEPGGLGLTGQGVAVGIFDGETAPHTDFGGRLHTMEPGQKVSHGMHVTGTIGGAGIIDPKAKGIAPAAELYTWDFRGDVEERYITAYDQYNATILHNSWGKALSCNYFATDILYNTTNELKDAIAFALPEVNLVFSGGNFQQDCKNHSGYFTATRTAKNIISVGAVDKYENMTSFSSFGPLGDGRLIPLVCAKGQSVYSTVYNNNYSTDHGTSMSAPMISGLLALLTEQYRLENGNQNPQAILLKNALLNTARDKGNPGPDYQFGYGIADGVKAAKLLSEKRYKLATIKPEEVKLVETITVPKGASKLRVMIVWHDRPGVGINTDLVNDLDLEVHGQGQIYLPLVLDPKNPAAIAKPGKDRLNNHEQVVIDNPAEGTYECIVEAFSLLSEKVDFSLSYDIDYEDDLRIVYPLGGESINSGKTLIVRWNTTSTEPISLQISYDGGSSFEELFANLDAKLGRALVKLDKEAWSDQVKIRLIQNGVFSENENYFTVTRTPEGESAVAFCSDVPGIAWTKLGDGVTYQVAELNKSDGKHTVLKSDLTDTVYVIEGYEWEHPVAVRGCKDGVCGDWSKPILPAGMRPIKIKQDDTYYSRPMEKMPDPYGVLVQNYWTHLIVKEGVLSVAGWQDGGEDWQEPPITDQNQLFELNPTYVATYYHCLDLTEVSDKKLHTFVQALPQTSNAYMRVRLMDENGENAQVLKDTWGQDVHKFISKRIKQHVDFDLTDQLGKKVVVACDMAVRGPAKYEGLDFVDFVSLGAFAIHTPPAKDIGVKDIILSESSVSLANDEKLGLLLLNFGAETLADQKVTVTVKDDNKLLFTEDLNVTLKSKEEKVFYLENKLDLSKPQTLYQINVEIEMVGDTYSSNNKASAKRS